MRFVKTISISNFKKHTYKILLVSFLSVFLISGIANDLKAQTGTTSPESLPLLTIDDLNYEGGFRIKSSDAGESRTGFAQGPIEYSPQNHSLFLVGHARNQGIAEFPIPEIVNTTDVSKMNITQDPIQGFSKVTDRAPTNSSEVNRISGMKYFPDAREMLVNGYQYYDASGSTDYNTLVVRDATDIASSTIDGLFKVEGEERATGWISPIPYDWQSELGGKWITGWASNMPINGRCSIGPSAFVFNPYDIVGNSQVDQPVTTERVLGFSLNNPLHDELSNSSGDNDLWTHLSSAHYGFIAPGTGTYVTIGRSGGHGPEGVCYKCRDCGGYCAVDPEDYYYHYWLWDVNDMVAVKNGEMEPYEVRPYEYGKFPIPFKSDIHPEGRTIKGGAFDPETGKLYLHIKNPYHYQSDYEPPPLILTYSIDTAASTEDTTAPTAPTDLSANAASDTRIDISWSASTDNKAVTGYKIYRDNTQIATTQNTSYSDEGLTNNTTYTYSVSAYDGAGNTSDRSSQVSATTQEADTAPPTRSNASPSGELSTGTTETMLSLTTNETATCKYSTNSNTTYTDMANTFTNTDATNHSTTITGLTGDTSYTYYVRCEDTKGNTNTADYEINFSVASKESMSFNAPYESITVDGSAADWQSVSETGTLEKVTNGNPSSSNLSGSFKTAWDDTNLYILAEVTDDTLCSDSGSSYWADDVVAAFIDAENNDSVGMNDDDMKLVLKQDNTLINGIGDTVSPSSWSNIDHAVTETASGYRAEIAIPFTHLSVQPTSGNTLGFDIAFYDDDDCDLNQDNELRWSSSEKTAGYDTEDTSLFGDLNLSGQATCGDNTCAPSETASSCPADCSPEGDLNRDGQVNSSDFGVVMAQWFQSPDSDVLDLNGDGFVDAKDLGVLMSNWGAGR